MSTWNAHQKLAAALRRMTYFETRIRITRARRNPAERKANTTARHCLARAYFDVQACWRKI
ncbi:MAG: hypothetical protein NTX56_12125 [Proteobacteria bacterium]|nr:hypothetical protein [Pseudomonadota bacterium]